MTEGKRNVNMGRIQKETKCIGPSLRAIKPGLGNTVQALAQDDKRGRGIVLRKQQRCNCEKSQALRMTKGRGYRLEQTATLQLQKVTGSQDDKKGRVSS